MNAKEKNHKNIIRANILLFFTYTILILFIFSLIVFWVKYALAGFHNELLSICLSLMSSIIIFHSIRFACKSSTIDNLKKSKLDQEGSELFLKRMNLLFVLCIIGSVLFCLSYLVLDRISLENTINQIYEKYSVISYKLVNRLTNYVIIEYKASFFSKLYSIIIIESGFVISFLSLIPYQKKVLEKYNK